MSKTGTTFEFKAARKDTLRGDALVVPLVASPSPPLELTARVDRHCGDAVSELLAVKAVRDEVGHLSHNLHAGPCRRVVVVSLGDAEKIDALAVRRAAASAARWLIAEGISSITLWCDGLASCGVDDAVSEWALGCALAGFRFDSYRKPDKPRPAKITALVQAGVSGQVASVMPRVQDALKLADAINYTRRLAHEPANVLTPNGFAKEARALGRRAGLKCTVLGAEQLKRMKMNGLLAVGQGASEKSCLIQIEYRGAPRARRRAIIVGKGITFDTGGYSIKPRAGLENLKFDMTGGATVMGVMQAAADLKLKCNLIGLVAVAENAVSDRAYKPGDILTMASGTRVEVTNTDAEGRLVLADALWYAQQKLKPTVLIDVATLTGGVGLALGTYAAGIMATDDDLAAALGEAGRKTHERLWRLPLWDDYRELMRSTEADIRNSSAKRDAHCIQGGIFLKEFIQPKTAWAHLDIAAVANLENGREPTGKGATGFGVRLLVEYLKSRG